ncbi:hypothetical protein SPURM210S_01584 [Streptomyces purpurascens]
MPAPATAAPGGRPRPASAATPAPNGRSPVGPWRSPSSPHPRANRSAAWSRNSSRNCCRSAVSPPPCGYRMPPVMPRPTASRQPLRHHEFNLSSCGSGSAAANVLGASRVLQKCARIPAGPQLQRPGIRQLRGRRRCPRDEHSHPDATARRCRSDGPSPLHGRPGGAAGSDNASPEWRGCTATSSANSRQSFSSQSTHGPGRAPSDAGSPWERRRKHAGRRTASPSGQRWPYEGAGMAVVAESARRRPQNRATGGVLD